MNSFQDNIDIAFQDWISLLGPHGYTNYTHMLSSSHILFYMNTYGALNKYSNQGWEHLNKGVKSFFFCATNKGGGGGKGQ